MTEYLMCKECGHEAEVSPEDPDSTFSDVTDHVRRRHGAGRVQAMNSVQLVRKEAT